MDPEIERIRLTLGAALAPSAEHGPRALLYGGTAALRRGCLDALQGVLERAPTPRPLVVRVPGPGAEVRLPDAITDAVESALEARRAPGGLYEDRGDEVVRSLGGWLFRARSVGFSGLALFIDDLDGHLDGRGRPGASFEPWFRTLLGAIARRAVTLVATARAADAAGAPSLPQETVALFSLRESLGGPSTVLARDPSTLVAALARRTFSRASLHRARSTRGSTTHRPRRRRGAGVLVAAGRRRSRASRPRCSPSPPPPVAGAEGVALSDLSEWSAALAASMELAAAIRAARGHALSEREAMRNGLRVRFARMPRRMERSLRGRADWASTRRACWSAPTSSSHGLSAATAPLLRGLATDEPSLSELTDLCAAHANALGARVSATVVLTGLRADLGETFEAGARLAARGARGRAGPSLDRARLARPCPRPRRGHRPHALGRRVAPAARAPRRPRGLPRVGLREGPPRNGATPRRRRVAGRGLALRDPAELALGVDRPRRAALRLGCRRGRGRWPAGSARWATGRRSRRSSPGGSSPSAPRCDPDARRWRRAHRPPPALPRAPARRALPQRDGFTLAACGISAPTPGMRRLAPRSRARRCWSVRTSTAAR
ncbi:MAG: hypothetical protein U0325_17610 [Polyangiales bacterium]